MADESFAVEARESRCVGVTVSRNRGAWEIAARGNRCTWEARRVGVASRGSRSARESQHMGIAASYSRDV